MSHHELTLPIDLSQVRALRVGDTVTLHGPLFGLRDATLIHLFDRARTTRFDLRGQAVIHTAPNVVRVTPSPAHPTGYRPLCVGTTTSARLERFTTPLLNQFGVRLILGKGGLGADSARVFRELGGAYLTVTGGAAALQTTWIEAIEDVDLDDLHPESLWRFRVKGFGPLVVTMDSHGGDLYRVIDETARQRRAAILADLGVAEAGSP